MRVFSVQKASWIAAVMLFLFIPPYFMWGLLSNNVFRIIFTILECGIFYHFRDKADTRDMGLKFLFIGTLLYYILGGIINEQSNLFGVIARFTTMLLITIPFMKREFSRLVYEDFLNIYVVFISISLSVYICAQLGYISPIGQITIEQHDRVYTVYPLLVLDKGVDILRFYGPFNEPGVVGTLGAVLLCTQKFNFKDWRTLIILLAGVLSMSLFFFALVIGYGVVYLVFLRKKYLIAVLFTVCFTLFYVQTKEDPVLYNTLWQRFEWDETNHKFKGDNRKNDAVDKFYDELKKKPAFWFGSPKSEVERFWKLVGETSSYKVIVLNSGMIFLILYLLFFVILAKKHKTNNKAFILFILVLVANTYQRPDIYSIVMIFIYSYFARWGLDNLIEDKNKLKKKKCLI